MALLEEHDQKYEYLGKNRHAFQQEQRQVDCARDSIGGAWLPRYTFGGRRSELTDSQCSANDDHAQTDRGAKKVKKFHPQSSVFSVMNVNSHADKHSR